MDPLGVRLHEEDTTKIDQAKSLIEDAEEEAEVPAETYLFDSWYCAPELIENVEEYTKTGFQSSTAIATSNTTVRSNAWTPSTSRWS